MILGRIATKEDRLQAENRKLRRENEKLERKLAGLTVRLERKIAVSAERLARAKEPSLSALKKRAWSVFSKWVRIRDKGICFTCGRDVGVEKANAGHYVDRSICGVILNFHPRNVHCQCVGCNLWKHGNKSAYRKKMIELYGQSRVDNLEEVPHRIRSLGVFKPTKEYYLAIQRKYKTLLEGAG